MASKLAYLISEYPSLSHSFIFNELAFLRKKGFEIAVASIREPSTILSEQEIAEAKEVFYIKKAGLFRCLGAHLKFLFKQPLPYLKICFYSAQLAFKHLNKAHKILAYFAESLLLLDWMLNHNIHHVHNHFGNPAATVALLASKSQLISYSLSIHGPDIFHNEQEELLQEKLVHAQFIRSISHFCKAQCLRLQSITHWDRNVIARCGVNRERFARPQNSLPPLSSPKLIKLLYVSRLAPQKGHAILFFALKKLIEEGLSLSLTVVGSGPLLPELQELSVSLGLSERIIFTGPIPQDQLVPQYLYADIFVSPSFDEGVPVCLMEAMAMGLPVVATQIAGVGELVSHGSDGLIVPPACVESLCTVLKLLIDDPEYAQNLGKAAMKKVEKHYDFETNIQDLANAFEKYL